MKEKIRQALLSRQKKTVRREGLAEAAVLVPLFFKDGEYHMLFTRRSNLVAHHKRQISFPGGGRDQCDLSLMETAIRESWEEIGLDPGDVEVLGELDDTPTTTSGFVISPIVAQIPYPYEFKVCDFEIDQVFDIPISGLLREAKVSIAPYAIEGRLLPSCTYEYRGWVIWGATAWIVRQFLEVWKSIDGTQSPQASTLIG